MSASEDPFPVRAFFANHGSSSLDPDFISDYIQAEQKVGRYSQGYLPEDLERIIGPFCTAPLGLTPKPHTDTFCLIEDLSFPRNDPLIPSINSGISSDDFPTSWGTFNEAAALILSLPPGAEAATFDISAAYRLTPIRPDQQHALCIFWDGLVYVDRAVMFGLASSAGVFGSIADMLVAIYKRCGFFPIIKWVDDFLVIRLPGNHWSEEDFMNLTAQAGVPWSQSKLRRFASNQRYIGFDWDLPSKSVSLPAEKLAAVQELLASWEKTDTLFSEHCASCLHGKLVHISCIFPLIRPFLRSISSFAANFQSKRAKLAAPSSVRADVSWIRYLLHRLPTSVPLSLPDPVDLNWWGDASTSFGIGVVLGNCWAVWKWAPGFSVGPGCDFDIGWAEAVAVELGLRLALDKGWIGPTSAVVGPTLVRSDNQGVVTVLHKGRSRSRETNQVLKHVYNLQATSRIRIHATYVPSRENIADALSRGDIAGFLRGFPQITTEVFLPLPEHLLGKLTSWSAQSSLQCRPPPHPRGR
jgi:hypothetical protein